MILFGLMILWGEKSSWVINHRYSIIDRTGFVPSDVRADIEIISSIGNLISCNRTWYHNKMALLCNQVCGVGIIQSTESYLKKKKEKKKK